MVWVNWKYFTDSWLERAEREGRYIDDGDRFISLWIAFNGWMKAEFGEDTPDGHLIDGVKRSACFKDVFNRLKQDNSSFMSSLTQLRKYSVADMRYANDKNKIRGYDGTFESLIEVLYRVRCNLFHGRKEVNEDKKDFELVGLSYRILLPLFKAYLSNCHCRQYT